MADEYDITKAFEVIENELMTSMMRNMKRHKEEEIKENKQWAMWQAEQLKALELYKKQNQLKYSKQFESINKQIKVLILQAKDEGEMQQEIAILNAIKNGFQAKKVAEGATAEFFKLNERKLEALIKATIEDMEKAETAVLRMANDQYRKIIYNAQVYANTGAGTYEQAVDMASKDFLSAGLNCIEYANGARHTLADYADMAIRTASKRAYLQGEGEMRQSWGISTVIVNKRGNPCPKCLPFCGKVLIDDVWSGDPKDGKSTETGIKYPLMSSAIAAGLYHPRCKDSHTTYFEGISTPPDDKYTKEELNQIYEKYQKEQKQQYAKRQAAKFQRLAAFSLDADNKRQYTRKVEVWKEVSKNSFVQGDISGLVRKIFPENLEKQTKTFNRNLINVKDENIYQLLRQSYKRVEFKRSDGRRSFFRKTENAVYLAKGAEPDTIAHELFHEIDGLYGITEHGLLKHNLQKDYIRLKKLYFDNSDSPLDVLYLKHPEMFDESYEHLTMKKSYRGISDIINGMSGGKINCGYGHSKEYWKKDRALEKEVWAQYGRMYYSEDNKVLDVLKEIFPDTTNEFERIIKEMIR